ncbi:septum formation initiator [Bifidobacterium ramosum]|uniref:Septum formation initiator n=2 Tax=Bifidobacterium ramosum TaxID=1798158 RepID=A0A6L4X074_9BIFI|nr:septum formation initiator [Bifidobacterium ramosum]NEG72225.1 septum formation initiator family protein [Bifidobacterium ramosum]
MTHTSRAARDRASDRHAADRSSASRSASKTAAPRRPSASARGSARTTKARTRSSGPIVFFIALFIVALGSIQLLSTFYTYAINLSELNGLKREEASLIAQKRELENSIARWNDKAYVAAQAREKLGFVFPGEQVVHVEHPEAVTGSTTDSADGEATAGDDKKALPWYSELAYSFEKADGDNDTSSSNSSKDNDDASTSTTNGADGADSTEDQQ